MLGETVIVLGNPFAAVVGGGSPEPAHEGHVVPYIYRAVKSWCQFLRLNIDRHHQVIYRQGRHRFRCLFAVAAGLWMPAHHGRPGFEVEETNGVLRVSRVDVEARPGVLTGDVVRCVGDHEVKDMLGYHRELLSHVAGDRFTLGIERAGEPRTVDVAMLIVPKPSGKDLAKKALGLVFGDRDDLRKRIRTSLNVGLPISDVTKGGAAAMAGLKPGLLVTRINETDIGSLDDVGIALEHVQPGEPVAISLLSIDDSGSFLLAQSYAVQVAAE